MAFNPGGGGGISGANDVALSSPVTNHALMYDGATAKWKNQLVTSAVTSVNAKTGAVTLGKQDIGLSSVDNTSDAAKPISTATQVALDAKAGVTVLTQTQYDALPVKNASMFYIIS